MKPKQRILKRILIAELMIVGTVLNLAILLLGSMWLFDWVFPELWGSHNLGCNLYKLDGDNSIVYGTLFDGRSCTMGDEIVPSSADCQNSEYVKEYKFDKSSIIVLTDNKQTGEHKYYIISKAFDPEYTNDVVIRARYLWEFTDSAEFIARCERDSIALRF